MDTDLSYTFECQLSEQHDKLISGGRWETPVEAAKAAGEYLIVCAKNNFINVMVRVIMMEEYKPLGVEL